MLLTEAAMEEQRRIPHNIVIDNRQSMSVSGVADVDSYDENCIVIITSMGELTIHGSELHIVKLSVDTGEMHIEGMISSLIYSDRQHSTQGLLKRLFR